MPTVDDIPKVRKLLAKRKKVTQKILALQKAKVAKAKIVLKPDESSEATPVALSPARVTRDTSWFFVSSDAWGPAKAATPKISIRENTSGTVKEFFLRALFEELALIDQKLFDLGFEFPEGYAREATP